MSYNNVERKYALSEDFDLDLPDAEAGDKGYPELLLVDKDSQEGESLHSPPFLAGDNGSASANPSKESEKEIYSDPQGGAQSPLVIYFKTINKYPLLNEKEEVVLAKLIKENEEEYKRLAIKWKRLFKKEFLSKFPVKQIKEIRKEINLLNGSFSLFDDLIKLEREKKKVIRTIKRLPGRPAPDQTLQRELYSLEAEISKRIAAISLSSTSINRIIKNLKKISHAKMITKKQQLVEAEMIKTLRKITKLSKEIKALKQQLIQANLRLVISIAKRYVTRGLTLPDLIQEGNLGLIRAIDTYDYRRGHRFVTYATWWIRQSIIRALDCHSRTIRTPVYMNEKMNLITKASNHLLQKYKREPTLEEIAEKINAPLELVNKVMQRFRASTSLDAFTEERGENLTSLALENEHLSTFDQVIHASLSQTTEDILFDLTQREREIIKLRFGIGENHDHTLEEIGWTFNLSRERIRQIIEVALNKLRAPQRKMKLKDFINLS